MAQAQGFGRRYIKAFFKGFFVAVPVTVTFLDRVACVARVEGASMQPSLNPGERQISDVVLLNHWSIRNYEVQRGDIVSLVSPKNPEQKIIKRVIALEGDIVNIALLQSILRCTRTCKLASHWRRNLDGQPKTNVQFPGNNLLQELILL
ncbi:mitochondrial inner membrane protease subunit 2 isoform X3 [Mauremys mutica]|uniref:mitochondrial inner membrane protease subunit 2 isoform X3 n=1 Tax=Mauremys mutica TaxID=74926 RepID=UPI001D13E731|nr:mitochondrial inner membrane protease subunit 2 isoform X3 [Mauremys mutica]